MDVGADGGVATPGRKPEEALGWNFHMGGVGGDLSVGRFPIYVERKKINKNKLWMVYQIIEKKGNELWLRSASIVLLLSFLRAIDFVFVFHGLQKKIDDLRFQFCGVHFKAKSKRIFFVLVNNFEPMFSFQGFTIDLLGFTGFYRVFIGFYWVLPSFTEFYQVLLGFTRFYLVLLGFTRFYLVLLGLTEFNQVLLSFTRFYLVFLGFTELNQVLLGFTGFYLVLLGLTEFNQVLLSFTRFYWVLMGFTGFYRVLPGIDGIGGLRTNQKVHWYLNVKWLGGASKKIRQWEKI